MDDNTDQPGSAPGRPSGEADAPAADVSGNNGPGRPTGAGDEQDVGLTRESWPDAAEVGDLPGDEVAGRDGEGVGEYQAVGGRLSGPVGPRGADSGRRKAGGRGRGKKDRSFWRELPVLIVVAFFLTLVIKTYMLQAFFIPSGSMEKTLLIGDRVLVNKLAFDYGSIHRGDIVVFSGDGSWNPSTKPPSHNFFTRFVDSAESMVGRGPTDNDYIKRVIGLPGDRVACCNAQGDVTVNGVPLHEPYLYPGNPPSKTRFNVKVPQGMLWVMGDHRNVSYDSRGHRGDPGGGAVPESAVVGRAFVIIWPVSQWRYLAVPGTFDRSSLNGSSGRAAGLSPAVVPGAVGGGSGGSGMPLAFGFAGAVPVTWLQRRLRPAARRLIRRRR